MNLANFTEFFLCVEIENEKDKNDNRCYDYEDCEHFVAMFLRFK